MLVLAVAALAGFLLRQPATILVKVSAGRRPSRDRRPPREFRPALAWAAVDLILIGLTTAVLVAGGHARILILAVPGLLVFAWHLRLVRRREDRRQMGIEIVGAGVLALAAPAAYLVCGGSSAGLPWLLWLLC
ncbi:MAG: hypothetical protein HW375_2132, partial [Anaerolineales bacterium]|nr:hypothetical protein [Anaerolineales bacterium]